MTVDEADLVWVAAVVSGADPEALLAESDVAALARIAARCELAGNAVDEAAAALVGVARAQPFPRANGATAWLAAAHVLSGRALGLRVTEHDALSLVAAARCGAVDEATAGATLAGWLEWQEPRRGRLGRALRWLVAPLYPLTPPAATAAGAAVGRAGTCPACGRTLPAGERDHRGMRLAWVGTDPFELTARCWYAHRAHRRDGKPFDVPRSAAGAGVDDRWCPVVHPDHAPAALGGDDRARPAVPGSATHDHAGPAGPFPAHRESRHALGGDDRARRAGADHAGPGRSFCAFVPAGGLLFLAGAGLGYGVVFVPDLAAIDLVGGAWDRLAGRGHELGRVGAAAIRLAPGGLALDLAHLAAESSLDLRALDDACVAA